MFKANDDIYYIDRKGNHWPGKVLDVKTVVSVPIRAKVSINHIYGDKVIWVSSSNLEHQGENDA